MHRFLGTLSLLLLTAACADGSRLADPSHGDRAIADGRFAVGGTQGVMQVAGTYDYVEEVTFLVHSDGAFLFGAQAEGPTLQVTCQLPDGEYTLVQSGDTFTGTLVHPTANCVTKGGQVVGAPWGPTLTATIEGRITGRAIHLVQSDGGAPPVCLKNGSARVVDGVAMQLELVGSCDLSFFPFTPFTARNTQTATRR